MPGFFASKEISPDPTKCFVMMPFAESFNAIYRLIQRCCREQGLVCERADEDVKPGKITSKIYEHVAGAGILIADMTGRNPNVFYEMGLAHAISDNVILLTQSTEDVPFNLGDFTHIPYSNTFDGAEKLANDLSKVLTTILRSAVPTARRVQVVAEEASENGMMDEMLVDNDGSPVGELRTLHLRAEIASYSGDKSSARKYLARALELARTVEGGADEIGNCAIEAERCKFLDLAETLYELALERDPSHVNNRQCFVSFVLDVRSNKTEALEKASSMLDDLEKIPERQERTRALRAQYLALNVVSGREVDSELEEFLNDVLSSDDLKSIESSAPILSVMQRLRRFDQFEKLIDKLRRFAAGREWELDRLLADCFAQSEDQGLQNKAIAIYEKLLNRGADTSAGLKHNLATLLFGRDMQDEGQHAFQLWASAYAQQPSSIEIRQSFAQYLVRHHRGTEAGRVLEGKPLH